MSNPEFSIGAYLERVGIREPETDTVAGLRSLHLAHRVAIPFENLDIQLGRPIELDIGALQAKLVASRRGGYCFEQNTLFLTVLRALGFHVEPCEARVRPPGRSAITPRTHMVLIAYVDDVEWLVDVGFGVSGPLEPVPLSDQPLEQFGWAYRIVRGDTSLVLQTRDASGWRDLYAFVPEPRYPVDFEVANWFTSTHPESRFVRALTAQRVTPEGRHVLHNLTYSYSTPAAAPRTDTTREIPRAELTTVLADTFDIEVPADARFRALDADA